MPIKAASNLTYCNIFKANLFINWLVRKGHQLRGVEPSLQSRLVAESSLEDSGYETSTPVGQWWLCLACPCNPVKVNFIILKLSTNTPLNYPLTLNETVHLAPACLKPWGHKLSPASFVSGTEMCRFTSVEEHHVLIHFSFLNKSLTPLINLLCKIKGGWLIPNLLNNTKDHTNILFYRIIQLPCLTRRQCNAYF